MNANTFAWVFAAAFFLIGVWTVMGWLRRGGPNVTVWLMRLFKHWIKVCPTCRGEGFVMGDRVATAAPTQLSTPEEWAEREGLLLRWLSREATGRCDCGALWVNVDMTTGKLTCTKGHTL